VTAFPHQRLFRPEEFPDVRDDPQWVERLRAGDVTAFEAVFHALCPVLCLHVQRYVGSAEIAEDVVQDLFLALWRKREQLDIQESITSYLYRAARNRAIDALRHERVVERWQGKSLSLPDMSPAVIEDELLDAEFSAAVQQAIDVLPERCRVIFQLHRQDGLSYAQIAHRLDLSINTVETQMGRALRSLRARLRSLLR
jgi:RNA polymerase sigma-70 factor (ECF subfamily)